jgi:hypothetical protein
MKISALLALLNLNLFIARLCGFRSAFGFDRAFGLFLNL